MVSWREREARNEARFRTQNEWVQTTGLAPGLLLAFVCECGDGECGRSISLTANEYEFVRATSNRFAIALNHENPGVGDRDQRMRSFRRGRQDRGLGLAHLARDRPPLELGLATADAGVSARATATARWPGPHGQDVASRSAV